MPTTTHRIAQTSTEVKRQYKKNGPGIPARQQRQLERAHELDQRAARMRDNETRRALAKKKREEKEEQQRLLRQQQGIGAATQAIGYNHTQARTKKWMESFLGVDKKKQEAKRRRKAELDKKLEDIANDIEQEPWDHDNIEDIASHFCAINGSAGEVWADDDLDDDTLLEAHDLITSEPTKNPLINPPLAVAPDSARLPNHLISESRAQDDAAFRREHGYINRVIEDVLDKLPESLVELLSLDVPTGLPEWQPPTALLHKLNPVGLPLHRLRIKVGCVVSVLRDLNLSSQLSRSQHLQILRIENERIECLVLDGQLEGTKTILTRVPFDARYMNQERHSFRRTQFPIRVAVDYTAPVAPREVMQSGFKLPSIPGRAPASSSMKQLPPPSAKPKTTTRSNPGFKVPGLPASKSTSSLPQKPVQPRKTVLSVPHSPIDGWDDFLESGTQIARELSNESAEAVPRASSAPVVASPCMLDILAPLSTQDLSFSLDDLDDESPVISAEPRTPGSTIEATIIRQPAKDQARADDSAIASPEETTEVVTSGASTKDESVDKKPTTRPQPPMLRTATIDLSTLRASQKPPSVSDRPGLKRKAWAAGHAQMTTKLSKRPCAPMPAQSPSTKHTVEGHATIHEALNDFLMSTQDVASFFDDDDDFFGSPPISV
ncbi:hypothetical protein ACN47E_004930 [Coniothyrium glycines]